MRLTHRGRASSIRGAAVATVLAVALVGCSDADDDESGASSGQQESAADAEELKPGSDDEPDSTGLDGDLEESAPDAGTDEQQEQPSFSVTGAEAEFLDPAELPIIGDLDPWTGQDPVAGLPENPVFCTEGVLPADGAWHRRYSAEVDGASRQTIIETASATAAAELMQQMAAAAAGCADDWEINNSGTSELKDHGQLNAGDAAHAYSMATIPDQASSLNVATIGIGRVGTTVTLVHWSHIGTLDDVPADSLEPLMSAALNRLAP